ncbi:hypothetical protein [Rhodoplanes sp. Z2-YC6860]|uniref:hypothetical protein n=1 Tax=Rhodoplanes sp. Z2-YC6860 TaxID=674703 RepID=UPI00078C6FB3|nr:hypothetical protein [Rhodoplanes sp. Z2-YC6860]AMN41719.1 hypothetical protein RHPLAN_32850 [Rhodoplanes sp. Z2-YC6860]
MMRRAVSRTFTWLHEPMSSASRRALFLLVVALAIGARIPKVWTEGRFWAEEGTVFFRRAWDLPWWQALFAPHANYLNIAGNAATLLAAHLTSLRGAPYVTATVAVLIQCLPVLLLVMSRDKWLQSRWVVWAAALVVVLAPVPEEVWANSTTSYNHLALCAAVILAIETQSGVMGVVHGCLLLLAALSGPASWILVPLFALRAVPERSKARALQGLVLLAGAIIQIAFFTTLGQRDIGTSPSVIGAIVLAKHILVPFLGHVLAEAPVADLSHSFQTGSGPLWPLALVVLIFAVAVIAAATRPSQSPLWFLLASALLAGTGYLGATDRKLDLIHAWSGGRHAFAPQVLIGFALLSWTVIHRGHLRILSGVILTWIVAVGAYNYFVPPSSIFVIGPDWREEVKHWQHDPSWPVRIWPGGWTINLSAR